MRKLLVITALLSFVCTSVSAQKKIGTYYNKFFDTTYEIKASPGKNGNFDLYIQVGAESKSTRAEFNVSSKNLDDFILALSQMRDKYIEWSDVATANNVTELRKNMDVYLKNITVCWHSSKWWFAFSQTFTPTFLVFDSKSHVVAISQKVTASDNQFIDERIYWVFSNADEINSLLVEIQPDKVREKLTAEENAENLFK